MSTVVKDLGAVSAYAYAVEKGYTGTEEEFAELMASYATVGQTAVTAAQTATTKASEAATSATTATNKASEATTAATTATNKAAEAQADADAAALDASQALSAASTATTKATEATTAAATAVSAKDDAVSANTAAQSAKTAAQTAQTGAETAAASVQSSAAQIQTNADDISELKEDLSESVGDLKSALNDTNNELGLYSGKYITTSAAIIHVREPLHIANGQLVKIKSTYTGTNTTKYNLRFYSNGTIYVIGTEIPLNTEYLFTATRDYDEIDIYSSLAQPYTVGNVFEWTVYTNDGVILKVGVLESKAANIDSSLKENEVFNSTIINQIGFFNVTKKGYYDNSGNLVDTANFSCSDIFVLDKLPAYNTTFHSVATWKNGTANGLTLYADIANVPDFDRIAFNYTATQAPTGTQIRYGGVYADPNTIEQNESDIANIKTDLQEIEKVTDGLDEKIGVAESVVYSINNQLVWINGLYTNTGEVSTVLANYKHSDFVDVIAGTKIEYTNLRCFGTWSLIAAFDANKQYLANKTLIASSTDFASGEWTIPDGVSYVSFAAYKPDNPETSTERGWQATVQQYIYVSELVQSAGSPWKGKTAVIIGDSITYGAYTAPGGSTPDQKANPTFWETAKNLLGLSSFIGYGISGTSISRTSATLPDYAMSIRYVDMVNADLVIVAGGTNDYGTNVSLGTIADQNDISFYGALNVLCDGLQTKYPGKRIVFITPIHRANEEANQAGATLEQYRQAIYDVARDVYGFAVIDGRTMGISCKNASFKNVYIYDGLHPTQEGHDVYGQCFGHALNGI